MQPLNSATAKNSSTLHAGAWMAPRFGHLRALLLQSSPGDTPIDRLNNSGGFGMIWTINRTKVLFDMEVGWQAGADTSQMPGRGEVSK
jgi:hypothetical protein